jgi:hypothetical protein
VSGWKKMPMAEEYVVVDVAVSGSCTYTRDSTKIEVTFFRPWNQMGISPTYIIGLLTKLSPEFENPGEFSNNRVYYRKNK